MKEIIIIDATKNDIEEMVKVRQSVWKTTYRGIYDDNVIDKFNYEKATNSFESKFNIPNILFKVALYENKIIGYVCFGKQTNKYKEYEYVIHYIHILRDYQGMGLGRRFFNIIFDYAKKNNIDKFYVLCNKYNYSAHKFYEKMCGILDFVSPSIGPKNEQHIIYVYDLGVENND